MNDAFAQLKVAFLKELPAINAAIQQEIDALHPMVRPAAHHVMDAGGKRLRPMLTILFARALDFRRTSAQPGQFPGVPAFGLPDA
jgi:octaprenyl-diphosphate synthase